MGTENVLKVETLGGFSMRWNGKKIAGGVKARDSQFTRLMQILLHRREEGIERQVLQELLLDNSSSTDIHHMLRSVIYNARKTLRKAGLPDINYIVFRKGRYYWTEQIRVDEDARRFEILCGKVREEPDPENRLRIYWEIFQCYKGEFLPYQTHLTWVVNEEQRYRDQFCNCVNEAAALLRERKDFVELERLGRYATRIHPLQDWEQITMEALVAMNQYEEARKLYEDTINYYMAELGVHPSFDMTKMLDKLASQMDFHYALLDEVQRQLSEYGQEEHGVEGAYLCTYPVFQGIYRMVERMLERQGLSACLMLCSILDSRGRPMKDGVTLTKLSRRLGDALCHSLRRGDVVCRYGKGQFLILLINVSQDHCEIIKKRIDSNFRTGRQRTGVQYSVASVADFPCWSEQS